MTKDELLEILRTDNTAIDEENWRIVAENALFEYINDEEITAAFRSLSCWFR